jgi:hypothetical protein
MHMCGVNQEKLFFSAPRPLVRFRESLHRISIESYVESSC